MAETVYKFLSANFPRLDESKQYHALVHTPMQGKDILSFI